MRDDPYIKWLVDNLAKPGKSQSGLARHLGVDPSSINKVVKRKRLLKSHEVVGAAEYFGEDAPSIEAMPSATGGTVIAFRAGVVEAGAFREVDEFADNPFDETRQISVPRDPQFPNARVLSFDVAGDSMNDLKPRPILPGDQVVGVAFEDVADQIRMRDGMVVVVERARDGGQTREWSVKQVELYEDRTEFHPRSTNKRHRPIVIERDMQADDGTAVQVIAVVRRIINDIPLS
ncbi:hypothetical protein SAMN06297251_10299 [Fulvimarina manganoxydans]|uniref:Uncharacterized protein n=1 Tax=Fulvimarina manganoxydans TaxID=937218 RepID=A0A1W1YYR6_9HYPH|nr:helix-turn-helix transcriptional regulator [Fulvimarina manganoxydans]SMC41339.1 hypothetical protein SAMN06297251_10299 [Fulvimarina manganoxydans]